MSAAVLPFPGDYHAPVCSRQKTYWQVLADKIARDLPPEPAPGTEPDTALAMWEARYVAIVDFIDSKPKVWPDDMSVSDDGADAITDALSDIECAIYPRICETPAASIAGVLVKARLVRRELDIGGVVPDWTLDTAETMVADLERIGGAS